MKCPPIAPFAHPFEFASHSTANRSASALGMLRTVLPSHAVLCAALSVEDLGGRPHQDAGARPERADRERGLQRGPQKDPHQLHPRESAPPQLLCVPLFHLRGAELCQRHRPDVFHELLLGRRVLQVWAGGAELHRNGAGAARRPDVARLPEADQVHVPQVWCVGQRAKVRRPVRAAAEHCEREDLRVPVVLVHDSDHFDRILASLSHVCGVRAQGTIVFVARPHPAVVAPGHRAHIEQVPDRRLVHTLSTRQKYRSVDFQGDHHRASYEIERQTRCLGAAADGR